MNLKKIIPPQAFVHSQNILHRDLKPKDETTYKITCIN